MQQRRLVPSPHAGTRFFSPHREKKHLLPEKPAQGEETSLQSLDNKPACLAKPMRGEETDVPRFCALVSTPHVRRRNVIFFSPCGEKKCHFLLPAITEAYSPRRFFSPRSLSDIPRLLTNTEGRSEEEEEGAVVWEQRGGGEEGEGIWERWGLRRGEGTGDRDVEGEEGRGKREEGGGGRRREGEDGNEVEKQGENGGRGKMEDGVGEGGELATRGGRGRRRECATAKEEEKERYREGKTPPPLSLFPEGEEGSRRSPSRHAAVAEIKETVRGD
ncbi:hypothetical protein B296_00026041 [Ensete ventricosum]|uniref:Uncharacterized protein n=1 Tax=Ensete ventricosum TaxID=4639 RepID=A0A426ZJA4_ENSVE|nr:hypothetical protein B296_00026041 [Ensete ventricosum]